MTNSLGIKEVAERTGIAAGTIRQWELRHGFPVPERTPSGYRRYSDQDVETLLRAAAYRNRGLSVAAALERARVAGGATDRPSIYAAIAGGDQVRTQFLRKRTLIQISRAIEDQAIAMAAAPLVFGAFQQEAFYRRVEHRYRALAEAADAVTAFAGFESTRVRAGLPAEIPIGDDESLGNEWAVIIDAPGYSACLVACEQSRRQRGGRAGDLHRRFECMWTIDPEITRRASHVAAKLAARHDAAHGKRLEALLTDRPLAVESPLPSLTALTNRMVEYLEAA